MSLRISYIHGATLCCLLMLGAVACGPSDDDSPDGAGAAGTEAGDSGTEETEGGGGGSGQSPPATEVMPTMDVNPCSVLSEADIAELGFTQFERVGSVVGLDGATLDFFPRCHWTFDTRFLKVEVAPGDTYLAGSDTADVGDAGHFSTNVAGDPELVFMSGDAAYTLVTDGVNDESADRDELLDIAARIIAIEGAQSGLFDGLSTAERAGGPAVRPCELIDADEVASQAGIATFLVYPSEGGYFDSARCHVTGGAFDQESVAFAASDIPCDGADTDLDGLSACFGGSPAGVGMQLSVDMESYRLVLTTQQDEDEAAIESRLRALASSIIAQL